MTVCEHFQNLARQAVEKWDGQSDLELLKLLADALGSPFWLNAYFEANKNRWHDDNCEASRRRADLAREDMDKENVITWNWNDAI